VIVSRHLLAAVLLVVVACGGEGTSGSLDCAWIESDNCWKRFVNDLRSCVPEESAVGRFNADGAVCVYDGDGAEVRFDDAVPRSLPEDHDWRFTLMRGEAECLRFQESKDGAGVAHMEASSGGSTIRVDGTASSFTVTCPDGSSVSARDPIALIQRCGTWWGLPSLTVHEGLDVVGLAFTIGEEPGGADIAVQLFDCQWP
jgi:hypothetical protein